MRSAVAQANQSVNQAGSSAAQYGGQANQIQSQLVPFEERQLTAPSGYSPQDMASMQAAAQQGAGGATGALTGQAELGAARARNAGANTMALDQMQRQKAQSISQANLDIQAKNAALKQQQQREAAGALGGYMTADQEAALRAQGLGIQGIGAETAANQTGWFQNFTKLAQAGAAGASAGLAG